MMSDSGSATVFLVDDDPSVLKAVSRLLRSAGMKVAAYASAKQFLEQTEHPVIGCLVLDATMPDITGPQLQERLNQAGTKLPIIFLTGDGDLPMGIRAMKAGALDFLSKPCPDEVLLAAIEAALASDRKVQEKRDEASTLKALFATLTPREHEVMLGVVAGHLNKQIARELGTAEKTVKIQRANMMAKMGVTAVADLVRLYERAQSDENPV